MIHFEVKNHNLTSDDNIGRADIKITEIVKSLNVKKLITIVDDNNFTKHVGELEITAEFKGTGLENLPSAAPVQPVSPQPIVQQQQQPIVQQQPVQQVQQVQQPVVQQQQYQQPIQQQPVMQQPVMQPVMQQPMYTSQQPVMQPVMQTPMYASQQPVMMAQPMMQQQPMMYGSQQPVMMVQPMMATANAMAMGMNMAMNMGMGMGGYQDGQEMVDPRHPHPLRHLSSVYQGTYTCNGCGQSGTGRVWHCGLCDFDLHPMCIQKLY